MYKVFKNRFAKFFYLVGLLMFVYGAVFLSRSFILGLQTDLFGSRISLVLVTFQDLIVILQYVLALRCRNYFIKFSNDGITYFLPKQCSTEVIQVQDVKEIDIKLNEVVIHLPEGDKVLRFLNVEYRELKQIKQRFEDLKSFVNK